MTSGLLSAAVGSMLATVSIVAQAKPSFDVASIKRSQSITPFAKLSKPSNGQFAMVNLPTMQLIASAYPDHEIQAAPSWVQSERYDVNAKYDHNASESDARLMIRELLTARFNFRAHEEVRMRRGYALVVRDVRRRDAAMQQVSCPAPSTAGPTASLPQQAKERGEGNQAPPCGALFAPGGIYYSGGVEMAGFTRVLSGLIGLADAPIQNATGMTGHYRFILKFRPEHLPAGVATDDDPSLETALQEQLGLKLNSQTIQIKSLIVDRIERPTED